MTTTDDRITSDPAGPPDEHTVVDPRPIRLRASDADRHAVVAVLQDATARGLLAHDEGGERMAAAWAARYQDELPRLTADLPVPVPGTAPPGWRQLASQAVAQARTTAGDLATGGWRSRQALVLISVLVVVGLLLGLTALHEVIGGFGDHAGAFGHDH